MRPFSAYYMCASSGRLVTQNPGTTGPENSFLDKTIGRESLYF